MPHDVWADTHEDCPARHCILACKLSPSGPGLACSPPQGLACSPPSPFPAQSSSAAAPSPPEPEPGAPAAASTAPAETSPTEDDFADVFTPDATVANAAVVTAAAGREAATARKLPLPTDNVTALSMLKVVESSPNLLTQQAAARASAGDPRVTAAALSTTTAFLDPDKSGAAEQVRTRRQAAPSRRNTYATVSGFVPLVVRYDGRSSNDAAGQGPATAMQGPATARATAMQAASESAGGSEAQAALRQVAAWLRQRAASETAASSRADEDQAGTTDTRGHAAERGSGSVSKDVAADPNLWLAATPGP